MNSKSGSKGTDEWLAQVKQDVEKRLRVELGEVDDDVSSHEYEQFKRENSPAHHTLYERAAVGAGKILALDPGKSAKKTAEYLETAHLVCTPKDVLALSILGPVAVFFVTLILTVILPAAIAGQVSLYYFIFSLILAGMAYLPLAGMPKFLAQNWRQRASNQMVLAVFYLVTYMRHTSNFELALEFAADHIGNPLALDLKKVLWDVETERYKTVPESVEHYLERWRDTNREFIEAVHLIMGSLYENSNERRVASLDKALEVMLEETYEKMLHYAQDLKNPITILHMLGIILPVLGLVILPLAVSFFDTNWTIIASFYNVILPLTVYYLGKRILSTRPTGYGSGSASAAAPSKELTRSARNEALVIAGVLFFIAMSPILMHLLVPSFDLGTGTTWQLLGYRENTDGSESGPFGIGAAILSLCMTLGAGIGAAHYYKRRSQKLIATRNETKKLELQFASALFLLGNRIADGVPSEIAFSKVAKNMDGTTAGSFFTAVAVNIQKLGLGVEDAIFDDKRGALVQYPSNLIESSMKVLVESSRKGPQEAAKALMSMSSYIKEMHRVDERLRDLLADVLSSMRSQINFLLPTIAGIVIGITSMITTVLTAIQDRAAELGDVGGAGSNLIDQFGAGIPTFYFQIIIGLYVVQITWVLAYLVAGIENGSDKISEEWYKGRSMRLSSIVFCAIALIVMIIFNLIAGPIISSV